MRLRGITSARVGADVEGAPVETASAALPPRSRRVPARFVVAVACVAGVAMSVSSAQGVTQPQPLTAQTVPQAVALAHSTGQPVVVVGALNGYNQVQANPDGTLSATMSAEPVRAADAGSATGYAPIDTTLSVEGGAVSPALTSVPTQFSAGGSGAAVVSSYANGEQVSVGSAQTLPAPTLAADTATYANITAGVSMTLQALPDGYEQRFQLAHAPAAQTDAIDLPITTRGLTPALDAQGRLSYQDASGTVVASGDPVVIYGANVDPNTGEPVDEATVKTALVPSASGWTLEIMPDPAFFQTPGLQYPVTIDPGSVTANVDIDYYTASKFPTTAYRTATDLLIGSGDANANKNNTWIRFYPLANAPTGSTADVLSANAQLYEFDAGSASCTGGATGVEVRNVENTNISASTDTWNTQPTVGGTIFGYVKSNAGGGSSCPAGWITMTDSSGIGGSKTMQNMAQDFFTTSAYPWQLSVIAEVQTGNAAYFKKFYSENYSSGSKAPKLNVDYADTPYQPSSPSPASGSTVTDTTPTFTVAYSDPNSLEGKVYFDFHDTTNPSNPDIQVTSVATLSGQSASSNPVSGFAQGDSYTWSAYSCNSAGTPPYATVCSTTLSGMTFTYNPPTGTGPSITLDSASSISNGIQLNWTAAAHSGYTLSGMNVYRAEGATPPSIDAAHLVASLGGSATAYTDTSVTLDDQYTYIVAAVQSDTETSYSNALSASAGTYSWQASDLEGGGYENTIAVQPNPPAGSSPIILAGGDNSGFHEWDASTGQWLAANQGVTQEWELKVADIAWTPDGDAAYALVGDCTGHGGIMEWTATSDQWTLVADGTSSGSDAGLVGCGYNAPGNMPDSHPRPIGNLLGFETIAGAQYLIAGSYANGVWEGTLNSDNLSGAMTAIALAGGSYYIHSLAVDQANDTVYVGTYQATDGNGTTNGSSGHVYQLAGVSSGVPTVTQLVNGPKNVEDLAVVPWGSGNVTVFAAQTWDNGLTGSGSDMSTGIWSYTPPTDSWTCIAAYTTATMQSGDGPVCGKSATCASDPITNGCDLLTTFGRSSPTDYSPQETVFYGLAATPATGGGSPTTTLYAGVDNPGTQRSGLSANVFELTVGLASSPTLNSEQALPAATTDISYDVNLGAGTSRTWWVKAASGSSMMGGSYFTTGSIAIDPSNPENIYVAGRAGVWESPTGGTASGSNPAWYPMVRKLGDTSNSIVAYDPNHYDSGTNLPDLYVANTDRTFVWLDNSTSPATVYGNDGPSGGPDGWSLAVDAAPPNPPITSSATVFLGTGDHSTDTNGQVWCTTTDSNGGISGTWTNITPANPHGLRPIAMTTMTNGSAQYLLVAFEYDSAKSPSGTAAEAGVYRYTMSPSASGGCAAGGTWTQDTSGTSSLIMSNEGGNFQRADFQAGSGGVVYLFDRAQGVFYSTDYGADWNGPIDSGGMKPGTGTNDESGFVAIDPQDSSTIYVSSTDVFKVTNADSGSPTVTSLSFPTGSPGAMFMRPDGQLYVVQRAINNNAALYRSPSSLISSGTWVDGNDIGGTDPNYTGAGGYPFSLVVDANGDAFMGLEGNGVLIRQLN